MADDGRSEARRESAVDRSFELQRAATAARGCDRAGDFAAAAVFVGPSRGGGGNSSLLRTARDWGHRLFADGVWFVDWSHDARANFQVTQRRLAQGACGF